MILASRISNQLLRFPLEKPENVVRHMTCIQSQNYNQHLRAIAVRCGCRKQDIEQLYTDGKLVRTRTQRGTIHAVCAEDAGWIVKLCGAKTVKYFERRKSHFGLSGECMHKMLNEIQKYCSNRQVRTRKEILIHLSQYFNIEIPKKWGFNITCYAASLGLIAMGPRTQSGEQGYILLSELTHSSQERSEEESLCELTQRYFCAHGYATIDDFAWRSGLGKTQIKKGITLCHDRLRQKNIDGKIYYQSKDASYTLGDMHIEQEHIHILPSFDEFLLGYKHRGATVEDKYLRNIDAARNGVFKPTIMINGKQVATWKVKKRTHERDITIVPFDRIETKYYTQIISKFEKYISTAISFHLIIIPSFKSKIFIF